MQNIYFTLDYSQGAYYTPLTYIPISALESALQYEIKKIKHWQSLEETPADLSDIEILREFLPVIQFYELPAAITAKYPTGEDIVAYTDNIPDQAVQLDLETSLDLIPVSVKKLYNIKTTNNKGN